MKKILALILVISILFAVSGCRKGAQGRIINNGSEVVADTESQQASITADSQETVQIELTSIIKNSPHCDMNYELSAPGWEYEKEFANLESVIQSESYTRVYKSKDENLKFFVTEYLGSDLYPGGAALSYGTSLKSSAEAICGVAIDKLVKCTTGYSDDMCIMGRQPIKTNSGAEIYDFCLQLPNENDSYYYVKGYIEVGIKHPVAIYFFDKTNDTKYDSQMVTQGKTVIKSLKVSD